MVELTKRKINPLVKIFLITVFLMISYLGKAQNLNERIFVGGGYTYFNQSLGDFGVKYLVEKEHLMIGANALIGLNNGKVLLIPEINATKYFNAKKFPFPFARVNVSIKTVTPQFGFSLLIAEFGVGYGLALDTSERYKTQGFRATLNINVPLHFRLKLY